MIMLSNPTGLPSAPIIRGTLKPHTSASRIPTFAPSAAKTHARFTATLDFPTPPLPEAIAINAVSGGNEIFDGGGACPAGAPRSCPTSAWRCSSLIGVSETSTLSTPATGWTAAVTSVVMRSRNWQPSMVSRTWTRTRPSLISIRCSIPMASIGLPISGSRTPRSASRICSSVTIGVRLPGTIRTYARCVPCKPSLRPGSPMPEPLAIEVHKVLADDTRYRLYRHLRLSGRPVGIRELSARSSLHPNTLRPHLRRLEEAGLISTEQHRGSRVGRPQTLYAATEAEPGHDYRILAEILVGLVSGSKKIERAHEMAREWGAFLAGRSAGRPAARRRSGPDLAALP